MPTETLELVTWAEKLQLNTLWDLAHSYKGAC